MGLIGSFAVCSIIKHNFLADQCYNHPLNNARFDQLRSLAIILDPIERGGARAGIMELMRVVLPEEDVMRIWRCTRGGNEPAMDFLYYLGTLSTTLSTFRSYLNDPQARAVQGYIDNIIHNHYPGDTLLSNLPHQALQEIATRLSPTAGNMNLQFTWRDVAGRARLREFDIAALNAPSSRAQERQSITRMFINCWISGSETEVLVLELVQALRQIRRQDVIRECTLFIDCRENRFGITGAGADEADGIDEEIDLL